MQCFVPVEPLLPHGGDALIRHSTCCLPLIVVYPDTPMPGRLVAAAMLRGDPKQRKLSFEKLCALPPADTDTNRSEGAAGGQAMEHQSDLRSLACTGSDCIVLGGDFNIIWDPLFETKAKTLILKTKPLRILRDLCDTYQLHDLRHLRPQETLAYTH
ncbi:hypothetical protein NDU88_002302 [Pleurodeles waltl]|uniref:Uncharacterized protein n=1 Tax=Pleurodeles waltl TaxID=8319 RepID=A0AAV7QBB0_PLEWA|nr:hypothetical protein NDU88_002302 [Pleurodeles waltl]